MVVVEWCVWGVGMVCSLGRITTSSQPFVVDVLQPSDHVHGPPLDMFHVSSSGLGNGGPWKCGVWERTKNVVH